MRLACFTLDHIIGFTDLRPTINSVPNFPFTSWRSNPYSTFLYSFDSARSLSFCLVHRGHSSSYDHGIVDTEFNEFVYRSCKISRKRCQRWQPEEKKKRKTRLKVTYVKKWIYRHKFTYEKRVVANSTLGADVSLLNSFYCLQSRSRGLSIAWLDKPSERLRKQ